MNWLVLKEILNLLKQTDILSAIFLIVLITISSCGLPDYEVLEPPEYYNPSGDYNVGFKTPNDESIDGYIIYYKIYYSGDDDLIDGDEGKFDESYYSNDDLPSGTTVPESLDFYELAYVDNTNNSYPHIPLNGSSTHDVYFDFKDTLNQDSDPVLYIDTINYNSTIGIPARGVTYHAVYSDSDYSFKRFLKNYEYDPYIDADLESMKDSYTGDLSLINSIEIAFVAISYGISSTDFNTLMSIPIYLGTVNVNNFDDNSANARDDS